MSDQNPTPPPAFTVRQPTSPVRFASSSNAFGLTVSPASSTSSNHRDQPPLFSTSANSLTNGRGTDNSPPSAGTVQTRRLRRPSMLSLAQTASFGSANGTSQDDSDMNDPPRTAIPAIRDPSSSRSLLPIQRQGTNPDAGPSKSKLEINNPFMPHASTRWGERSTSNTPFLTNSLIRRTSSAPPLALEGLSTQTPSTGHSPPSNSMRLDTDSMDRDGSPSLSPTQVRWHNDPLRSGSRKGKAKMDIQNTPGDQNQPFTGRPLPAPLLATLISERAPLEHEMRSEARLQRLLHSHPSALPLTPRAPRSVRGRFPETAGDDDDDDDISRSWRQRNWLGRGTRPPSSDSDSDDGVMEEVTEPNEPVNAAFAAGMDMDRPVSRSSSSNGAANQNNGNVIGTPQFGWGGGSLVRSNAPRMSFGTAGQAAGMGMVPSPGTGIGLPSAFGGLGMGGGGTPVGSPTIERLELAGSPGAMSVASPNMLQYRESTGGSASVRPGKRKAAQEDRFDPYKRPRGSSPSLLSASPGLAMSPSRGTPMPIPQSPSHAPLYSSALNNTTPQAMLNTRGNRAYARPMPRSRSRAASPALSIGSTSGVLSTSLGNNGTTAGGRPSFSLGQAFIPTGPGSSIIPQGGAPQGLGGLGLLSLSTRPGNGEGDDSSEDGRRRLVGSRGSRGSGGSGGEEMMRGDSIGADSTIMEED